MKPRNSRAFPDTAPGGRPPSRGRSARGRACCSGPRPPAGPGSAQALGAPRTPQGTRPRGRAPRRPPRCSTRPSPLCQLGSQSPRRCAPSRPGTSAAPRRPPAFSQPVRKATAEIGAGPTYLRYLDSAVTNSVPSWTRQILLASPRRVSRKRRRSTSLSQDGAAPNLDFHTARGARCPQPPAALRLFDAIDKSADL